MVGTVYLPRTAEVLAEYRPAVADEPDFWADRWQATDYTRYFARYRNGYLGAFAYPFTRYLPRHAPVLEAGCGRGQYVVGLRARGYDAYGIEFASDTVRAIRAVAPGLQVEAGDLRDLRFDDGFFGGYISLGVIEHYWDGPDRIMREAHRVLRPGGTLLLSVPHYNPSFRRRIAREGPRATARDGDGFYQFYFTRPAIERLIESYGFRPVDAFYYAGLYGAKRAFPRFDRLYEKNRIFRAAMTRLNRLNRPQALLRRFSHMILIVARKCDES